MDQLPICEHIKIGGLRCGSPALRDQKYCHHHAGVRRLVPRTHVFLPATPAMEIDPTYPYQLPYLEDFEALQIGYMQFIRGVADDRLDPRRAKLILDALKSAGANLRHKDRLMARAAELSVRRKPPATVKEVAPKKGQQTHG
jgi:hypothetical protein